MDYVYHGIDKSMKKHSKKSVKNLPNEYILAVGRINIRKNISTLIKSMSLIKNKNMKLVIVGEDSWKRKTLMLMKIKIKNSFFEKCIK